MSQATLRKHERICNFHLIEQMFSKDGSKSLFSYPVRMLYMPCKDGNKVLISVPKKHFKHAVDRNRIKRQVREAYRCNKHLIEGKSLAMAFIWTSNEIKQSLDVENIIVGFFKRITE